MGKWLSKIKENNFPKTGQLPTDKTDKSPCVSNVSVSLRHPENPGPTLTDKPREVANKLKIETRADILALPLNPCLLCGCYKYLTGYCDHYRYRLPEPAQECRCVHYKPRKH